VEGHLRHIARLSTAKKKNEFILMYDDVRSSAHPEKVLLDFCQSTYEAAALGNWDRANLER
jgi:Family of unknown function (DUF5996)